MKFHSICNVTGAQYSQVNNINKQINKILTFKMCLQFCSKSFIFKLFCEELGLVNFDGEFIVFCQNILRQIAMSSSTSDYKIFRNKSTVLEQDVYTLTEP